MKENEIIDYLVGRYYGGVEDGSIQRLPATKEDERPKDNKVGIIGEVLSSLCIERFRRYADALMVFDGKRYQLVPPQDMKRIVCGWMKGVGCGPAYIFKAVDAVFKALITFPYLDDFCPRRNVIYTRNWVLVLNIDGTVDTHKHGPEWMSNIFLDIDYISFALCPQWEKFLSTVIDDPNAVKVLQEFLGAMFIDKSDLSVETALFLYGIGSNGKSVICETLSALLGSNMSSVGLSQVNGNNGGDYFTASLVGKLLAYNSDEAAKDIGSGKFKQLVSKEKLQARMPYGTPFETDDWPMFMANINKALITSDSSEGFWRRNKVIKFTKRFVDNPDASLGELQADRGFKTSLFGELPGIFNWILEGRTRLIQQRGVFTKSLDIERVTEEMRAESTAVFSFLESKNYTGRRRNGEIYREVRASGKNLYDEYRKWCSENGYSDAKNVNRFKNDMEFAGVLFKKSMRFADGSVTSGYVLYEMLGSDMQDDDLPMSEAEKAAERAKIMRENEGASAYGEDMEDELDF